MKVSWSGDSIFMAMPTIDTNGLQTGASSTAPTVVRRRLDKHRRDRCLLLGAIGFDRSGRRVPYKSASFQRFLDQEAAIGKQSPKLPGGGGEGSIPKGQRQSLPGQHRP